MQQAAPMPHACTSVAGLAGSAEPREWKTDQGKTDQTFSCLRCTFGTWQRKKDENGVVHYQAAGDALLLWGFPNASRILGLLCPPYLVQKGVAIPCPLSIPAMKTLSATGARFVPLNEM